MARYRPQRIRDPLHDLIEFEGDAFDNLMWKVIQTQPFQRLRRVKQLGFSELVYPGATHSRMSHSIGVFHIARTLMRRIQSELTKTDFEPHRAETALAAALVHDVGHGPFSHSFETVGKRLGISALKHESTSARIIRETEISEVLSGGISGFSEDVARIIEQEKPVDIYSAVVSSQFDADRLDYMRRDRLMTGTQHSEIDFTWLIANLRIGTANIGVDNEKVGEIDTLVLDNKALFAAEGYVLGLFHLYQTVYLHKATRSAEKIFTELLVLIVRAIQNGDTSNVGLPKNHPLVKFSRSPNDLEAFMALDDTIILGSLPVLSEAKDPIIARLSTRLRTRRLWKAFDLRQKAAEMFPKKPSSDELERVVKRTKSRINSWLDEDSSGSPRIVVDSYSRSPYSRFQDDAGPLNQILLDFGGRLSDLAEVSQAISGLSDFKIDRVYFEQDDSVVKEFVEIALRLSYLEEQNHAG